MTSNELEAISRSLGDGMSGSEITAMLGQCHIEDNSNQSTKWRRIYSVFGERQKLDGCSNAIVAFIQKCQSPVRFVNSSHEQYDDFLYSVNRILIFMGLEVGKDGLLRQVNSAVTIGEVEQRTQNLKRELEKRSIHSRVLVCCKKEYLQENYFHAVFEAAKSLSDRVRDLSGIQEDGSKLFNLALSITNPKLALNSLQTSSERNQQNGLKEMLNGITHMIRNVTAHEMKFKWIVNEQDAIDILTTISFLHKRLDECVPVR